MKILLFKASPAAGGVVAIVEHALDTAIVDATRGIYTHAAILKDELTNTISEAFFPHVRERVLDNSELHGIDVFDVSTTYPEFTPLSAAQVAGVLAECAASEKLHEEYSIGNLFRFIPGVQELIGKARDDGHTSAVFCMQYVADKVFDGAGLKILNADSSLLAPGYAVWSVLLVPAPPLQLMGAGNLPGGNRAQAPSPTKPLAPPVLGVQAPG